MDRADQDRTGPEDPERREEVELTARLIVAANEAVSPLSQEQIDQILGILPAT